MSDIIDGALARIHHAGPELIVGGPNHGPMGAETLVTLGLDERDVMEWIDGYSPRLAPMPAQAAPVDPASPNEALGQPDRVHDWWTFFNRELEEAPWQGVLEIGLVVLLIGVNALLAGSEIAFVTLNEPQISRLEP